MRPWPSALARPTSPSVVLPCAWFLLFGPSPVYRDRPLADLLDFVDYTDHTGGCQRRGALVRAAARRGAGAPPAGARLRITDAPLRRAYANRRASSARRPARRSAPHPR